MNTTESNSLPFPVKLKRIVDLPETDHLIYWDEDGLSFHIADQNQFAHDVIPHYFKHNNISSFIRQLNMYGFHKINRIENGLAVIGNGNEDSQWSHPQFIRDKPELVQNITRKVTNPSFSNSLVSRKISNTIENDMSYESVKNDIATLAKAVQQLKQRDEETTDKLKSLTDENNHLYTTLMYLQEEHEKQSKLIDILIKFFSIYANNPPENRLKSKRVLALELPQSASSLKNSIEPPTKYFVASPDNNYPQVSVTNNSSNSSNNLFKGKKIIKITNVHNPQIDIKTPKNVLNNINSNNNITINSNNNNKFCGISTINNIKTQNPGRLMINIPKSTNNNVQPNRAITIFQSNNNNPSIPTIVIPPRKITQPTPVQINTHKGTNNINKIAKSVTVSSMDEDPNSFNAHYINSPNQTSINSFAFNNKTLNNNDNTASFFNVDEFLNSPILKNSLITNLSPKLKTKAEVHSVINDITANVSSVGKSLNQIKKCLTTDNSYPTNTVTQSNISDLNFDLDVDDSEIYVSNDITSTNNNNNSNNNADEMAYDELKMLWENIRNGNLDEDFPNSDSSRIQGHELIPFNTHRNELQEPVYNYHDNFLIDDFLQTPELHHENSSLSLNGLKDSLCQTDDLFQ